MTATSTPERGNRVLFRASVWSGASQLAVAGAGVVLTPLLIRTLGFELYGIYALITVIMSYLVFADVGMGAASTRFAAEAAQTTRAAEGRIIWTALAITAAAVGTTVAIVIAVSPVLVKMLGTPADMQGPASLALRLAACAFFLKSIAGVLNTPQVVRYRMDLQAVIIGGGTVFQSILIGILVLSGGGLTWIFGAILAVSLGQLMFTGYLSWKLSPALSRPIVDYATLRQLFTFGGTILLLAVVRSVLLQGEKLILARETSTTTLGAYAAATGLASMFWLLPQSLTAVAFPWFAATSDPERLCHRVQQLTRAVASISIPLLVFTLVLGDTLLHLWTGAPPTAELRVVFIILVTATAVGGTLSFAGIALVASGNPQLTLRYHMAELVPYVVLTIVVVQKFGIVGAAAVCGARSVLSMVAMWWLLADTYRMPWRLPGRRAFLLWVLLIVVGVMAISPHVQGSFGFAGVLTISAGALSCLLFLDYEHMEALRTAVNPYVLRCRKLLSAT